MSIKLRSIGFGFALALLASGCGGALFKVKPTVGTPMPDSAAAGRAEGVEVHAAAIDSDEESNGQFGANLPLSGILPVRIEVRNSGNATIDLAQAHFVLRDGSGREWKARSPKATAKHVRKYYQLFLYNPNSNREYLESMQRVGFDQKEALAPGTARAGFLFFQSPVKGPVERPAGLILSFGKLPQKVEIALN